MKPFFINDFGIDIVSYDAIVVGSGAAGFNAANRLYENGVSNIAIITEKANAGTSRNTGSDKQTYYKLTLEGNQEDSMEKMANVLYSGGAMHGDHALIEAANSVRAFMNLVELGVPFPTTESGEYIGYKTDHDPNERGTSVGPLTSKYMTQCLEKRSKLYNITLIENELVIKILNIDDKCQGIVSWHLKKDLNKSIKVYLAPYVVMATGGPAAIYEKTVYPNGHHGSSGICFEAGAKGNNLTEWQYGIGSLKPRWNLSGTYMQALPSTYSVDDDGKRHNFIEDYFENPYDALDNIFLKGYQWPFDVNKLAKGSSIMDILIFHEGEVLGRKIYIDFRTNPYNMHKIDFTKLSEEAYYYIKASNGIAKTPIERLKQMNTPAYEFYKSKGVDLRKENMEIAINPQHNNGGLAVDSNWETSLRGLFACGEIAGTHGITRPGGSALNSGQVGSLRAAQEIAMRIKKNKKNPTGEKINQGSLEANIKPIVDMLEKNLSPKGNVMELKKEYQSKFNQIAGPIRILKPMQEQLEKIKKLLQDFDSTVRFSDKIELKNLFIFKDLLISQYVYLWAMVDYRKKTSHSRGSALYIDNFDYNGSYDGYMDYTVEDAHLMEYIQEVRLNKDGEIEINWRKRRPIPVNHDAFEVVWQKYREHFDLG